jgi:hypothetical protein
MSILKYANFFLILCKPMECSDLLHTIFFKLEPEVFGEREIRAGEET